MCGEDLKSFVKHATVLGQVTDKGKTVNVDNSTKVPWKSEVDVTKKTNKTTITPTASTAIGGLSLNDNDTKNLL